jgi:3-oxoacyl-[acyl-carrier protein] reductase
MVQILPLDGKVAVVTGGSRGIGSAIVRQLVSDGAFVGFTYISGDEASKALTAELGEQHVLAIQADQADGLAMTAMIRDVHSRYGALDILIISAGVAVRAPVDKTGDEAALSRQMAVNLTGPVAAVRAAAPLMADNGRIVLIGSTAAIRMPFQGLSDYTGTKAALTGYARGWARDLGPRGITVNVIQPGAIDTDMNPKTRPGADQLAAMAALGRYGRADEIAAAAAFLVSPSASYISGVALPVDGGQNA